MGFKLWDETCTLSSLFQFGLWWPPGQRPFISPLLETKSASSVDCGQSVTRLQGVARSSSNRPSTNSYVFMPSFAPRPEAPGAANY